MKKLFLSVVLPAILIFAMAVTVFAAPSGSDISYEIIWGEDADGNITQTVSIKGEEVDGAANKRVVLRLWKEGKTAQLYEADVLADGIVNDMEYFAAFLQTRADIDGNFEFDFLYNENAGTYAADIKVQGEEMITVEISTSDVNAVNEFVAKINSSAELETMDETDFQPIFDNADDYGIITTVYNYLTDENKIDVIENLIGLFVANNNDGVRNTFTLFNDEISKEILLEIFSQTDDGEILSETFDVYDDILNIDDMENASGIDELYDDFGESKDDVLSKIGKSTYDDVSDLLDAFKSEVFVNAIKLTEFYSDIETIIENNLDYLKTIINGSKLDEYNNSSALRRYVLKQLNKNKLTISDIDDFEDEFCDAIDSYGEEEYSSGGGGGGSSVGPTINAELNKSSSPVEISKGYKDMIDHWALPAVTYLSNMRVLSGRGDGVFDPDSNITRAEYVKMIVETYALFDEKAEAQFEDVSKDAWYYKYVASMVKKGYITGDTDSTFRPNALISRQDMTVILYRVLIAKGLLPLLPQIEVLFDDFDNVSQYAQNSVAYMSNMKLVNGADGQFRPHNPSTRAEAAQIIYNAITEVGVK